MAKLNDLTGKRFDKLTVIGKRPSKNRKTQWYCQCDCGNTIQVSGEFLTRKCATPRDCGCGKIERDKKKEEEKKKKLNYLVGKRFGKLTVLNRTNKSNNNGTIWLCQCDCGNIKEVATSNLTSGNTKSCGCLVRETHMKDLTGKRFGKLVALKVASTKRNHCLEWICQCDCGNICQVESYSLTHGTTKSCGCITRSIGEENIEKILIEANIHYKREYTIKELDNKRFDFCIYNNQNQIIRFIEFDGEQHYSEKRGTWLGAESLSDRQKRDQIKNEYALSHNIPLIRIPYWERDKITLNMIMGDQYLIKQQILQ